MPGLKWLIFKSQLIKDVLMDCDVQKKKKCLEEYSKNFKSGTRYFENTQIKREKYMPLHLWKKQLKSSVFLNSSLYGLSERKIYIFFFQENTVK